MNLFLITFMVTGGEVREQEIVSAIKSYGTWARITPSTWCIKTVDKTTADIRDDINNRCSIQDGERLFVVNITNAPWASFYLPKSVADWLKEDK